MKFSANSFEYIPFETQFFVLIIIVGEDTLRSQKRLKEDIQSEVAEKSHGGH